MQPVTLKIDSQAHLVGHLPVAVADRIKGRLTFSNPAFLKAEKRGFYTGNLEQEIVGYQVGTDVLSVSRGFARQLVGILRSAGVQFKLDDRGTGTWVLTNLDYFTSLRR